MDLNKFCQITDIKSNQFDCMFRFSYIHSQEGKKKSNPPSFKFNKFMWLKKQNQKLSLKTNKEESDCSLYNIFFVSVCFLSHYNTSALGHT